MKSQDSMASEHPSLDHKINGENWSVQDGAECGF